MDREDALALLREYVSGEALTAHCVATGAIMERVGAYLGEDAGTWELIGILHDIDYELVEGDMTTHGAKGGQILQEREMDDAVAGVVERHNHTLFGPYTTPVEIALQASDSISGLVIACALVKGGKITGVTPKTVKKKMKEKAFAAGCDRDRIRLIEPLVDLPAFYQLAIDGLVGVKGEIGLE
ncbi:MAG: HDIG domain-containing protein [Methanomicrobiaceae archaeon]|nr:HDIG domain-containing protein [Methanomicrobiaceae archaeon]